MTNLSTCWWHNKQIADLKRIIGHIDSVAKIGHIGTIYTPINPYRPYYYNINDLRFAYKPSVWVSMNDKVEFSMERIGDKYYARNITYPGGKPLRPFVIKPFLSISTPRDYWSSSIKPTYNKSLERDESDSRIRVSSVIHPKQRTYGIVISTMKNDFGWILCNVINSLPIRYHITQIQSTGIKKLVLHSRVELNVIKGREHDWAFYITKPGGNLVTYEKADIYGQWLRSLELYEREINYNKNKRIYKGYICEYSLRKQIGFIVPFDTLYKRYMFHIDNCNTAKCENRRVFINDDVEFQLEYKEKTGLFYAVNVRSLKNINGIIHGKHWNWNKMLPYNRKYRYSMKYLHCCIDKLDEKIRYCGLVEFNAYEIAKIYTAKIYFDSINLYPRTLRICLNELQCTDVKYIRRGTRIEFSINIDKEKKIIKGVTNITGPNGRLLTFLNGERGEFYRWRNINCNVKLSSILNELDNNNNVLLIGFIRDLDIKGNYGVIEIISNNACYEPVFFWFIDVIFENNKYHKTDCLKISSIVQFNVTINIQSYLFCTAANTLNQHEENNENGYKWTKDPISYLIAKAINIVSYGYNTYPNNPPLFKMSHVQCINHNKED